MQLYQHLYLSCTVRDPGLIKRIGEATALEVRATGIQYTFAPCIAVSTYNTVLLLLLCKIFDEIKVERIKCYIIVSLEVILIRNYSYSLIQVCRDPRWGRCYESYSEDHKIVQSMTEIINGLQGDIPAKSRKGVPFVGGK